MNLTTKLHNARDRFNAKQGALASVLMLSPMAAFAAVDPSTEIVAEITKGKGYGIAAAVAAVVAIWAIRAVWMAGRKG